MINYVYAFKNKKSGNFNKPMFDLIPLDDALEAFTTIVKESPESDQERLKELELYYLGEFDTKTGSFTKTDGFQFILDCEVVLHE